MTYIVLTTGDDTETGGGGRVYRGLGNDTLIGSAGTDWLAGDGGGGRFDRVRPAATQPPHRTGKVAFRALASNCC